MPVCIWRWVQVYGPELDKRCRRHLKQTNRSWRLDETYINKLWVSTKQSPHTRRAYEAEIRRFRQSIPKPLALVTLADLQAYSSNDRAGKPQRSQPEPGLNAIKLLLSFGQETGYLGYNSGAAIKLRRSREGLSERI